MEQKNELAQKEKFIRKRPMNCGRQFYIVECSGGEKRKGTNCRDDGLGSTRVGSLNNL